MKLFLVINKNLLLFIIISPVLLIIPVFFISLLIPNINFEKWNTILQSVTVYLYTLWLFSINKLLINKCKSMETKNYKIINTLLIFSSTICFIGLFLGFYIIIIPIIVQLIILVTTLLICICSYMFSFLFNYFNYNKNYNFFENIGLTIVILLFPLGILEIQNDINRICINQE
jgi:hypothetical protein